MPLSFGRQVRLLLGKATLTLRRNPGLLLGEILLPCFLFMAFNASGMSRQAPERMEGTATVFDTINVTTKTWMDFVGGPVYPRDDFETYSLTWNPLVWDGEGGLSKPRIWWAPSEGALGTHASEVMSTMAARVAQPPIPSDQLRAFPSGEALRRAMAEDQVWCGVLFELGPPNWRYRLVSNGTYSPDTALGNQAGGHSEDGDGEWSKWVDSGLALMQRYVDGAIISSQNARGADRIVGLRRGKVVDDPGKEASWILLWLVGWTINISNMFAFNSMLNQVFLESKADLDRALRLVGVTSHAYWIHWFLALLPAVLLRAVIQAGVSYLIKVTVYSSFGLVFAFFLLHHLALALVAIVAARASDRNNPGSVGLAATFILSCAYLVVMTQDGVPTAVEAVLAFTNPWFAAFAGGGTLAAYDGYSRHVGVTAGNAWDCGLGPVLLAQSASVLAWGAVCAAVYSRAWRSGAQGAGAGREEEVERKGEAPGQHGGEVRVRGEALGKVFGGGAKGVVALDGLDIELRAGEIFGLLGLNGAGKSTAIGILSGELAPSRGRVVYNLDGREAPLEEDPDFVRARIGVCLQKDALVESLSVREHLDFFGSLKAVAGDQVERQVQQRVVECGLEQDAEKLAKDLSGGTRRKLSLAIALLGDPSVLYLDEPTAGMDPLSRRRVWDTVLAAKEGRAVVLTTHLMEEAEMLASRIGVVKAGKMVACGTSLALKHEFGAGYTVSCTADKDAVDAVMQAHVPGAKVVPSRENPGLREYGVPLDRTGELPAVLSALEATRGQVELRLTTLEEVFMKIAGTSDEDCAVDSNGHGGTDFAAAEHDTGQAANAGGIGSIWEDGLPPSLADLIWPAVPLERTDRKWNRIKEVAWLAHRGFTGSPISFFFGVFFPVVFVTLAFTIGATVESSGGTLTPSPLSLGSAALAHSHAGDITVFGIAPSVAAAAGLSAASKDQYDSDVEGDAGFWVGGVSAVPGGVELEFNTSLPASVAILQGLLANASLAALQPPQSVAAVLEPQPFTDPSLVDVKALLIPLLSATGFVYLSFVLLTVTHWRTQKNQLLLRIMSVSLAEQYAGISLQRVLAAFLPTLFACLIAAGASGSPVIGDGGRWLAWVLLMVSYAFAALALPLALASAIRSEAFVFQVLPTLLNLITILPFIAVWILSSQEDAGAREAADLLGDIMAVIPTIAYQRGMQALLTSDRDFGPEVSWGETFGFDMRVMHNILLPAAVGVASVVAIAHQSSGFLSCLGTSSGGRTIGASGIAHNDEEGRGGEDADVRAGRELAERSKESGGIAVVGMSKVFEAQGKQPPKEAVRGLALSATPGEVCALLGPNGAGKTTTLRMLTGDLAPSGGALHLDGKAVDLTQGERGLQGVYRGGIMGYCPQFESTFTGTTLWEHLMAVAGLKGLERRDAEQQAEAIMQVLDLTKFRDRRADRLSGGNQKKLNLAMAILGNPKVLLLDEPSTGLDPFSRRRMWKLLRPGGEARSRTSAMLISTHYMDEAAHLATRVVIMVSGAVKACGSVPHLVNRYCSRTSIDIVVAPDAPAGTVSRLEQFLLSRLPDGTTIVEKIGGRLKAEAAVSTLGQSVAAVLGPVIALLEEARTTYHIQYYSVVPMSLEQIFVEFASKQTSLTTGKA